VTSAAMYHYRRSREALATEALDLILDEIIARLTAAAERESGGSAPDSGALGGQRTQACAGRGDKSADIYLIPSLRSVSSNHRVADSCEGQGSVCTPCHCPI